MNTENKSLVANVHFYDVDGNAVQRTYRHYPDVSWLLEALSTEITDEDNFPEVFSDKFPGINGIIDISKPLKIMIMLQ